MPLQIVANDSQPGRTLTYTATGLPTGVGISSTTGLITGTPTVVGNNNVTVTVTNNVGIVGQTSFGWAITSVGGQGTRGFVGCTENLSSNNLYGSPISVGMTTFDSYIGGGRTPAHNVEKIYFQNKTGLNSQWPTSTNNPVPLGSMKNAGCQKFLISFKPNWDITGNYTSSAFHTEKQNLIAALNLYKNANINFDVTFYQEPQGAKNPWNANNVANPAASWKALWSFYGPAVQAAGIKLVYDPSMNNNTVAEASGSYFPSSPNPDVVMGDWYSNDFLNHSITLTALANKADSVGAAFGLAEIGPTSASGFLPTQAQWYTAGDNTSFIQYIINFFNSRVSAGKNCWDIIYYSDVTSLPSAGYVDHSTDYKVPGLRALYDALNG